MEETDSNRVLFDELCRAYREIAGPIVRQALMRENEEFSREFPGQDYLLDEQEIQDHTHDASRMMMGALIDILRDTFSRLHEISIALSDDLVPSEQSVRPEFWQTFRQLAPSFSLTNDEAADIRRKLGDYLFAYYGNDTIPLPFNLFILRMGDKFFLVRRPIESVETFRP